MALVLSLLYVLAMCTETMSHYVAQSGPSAGVIDLGNYAHLSAF